MALVTYSSGNTSLSGLVNEFNIALTPLLTSNIAAVGFNAYERTRSNGFEFELWATTEASGNPAMDTPYQVAGFQDNSLSGAMTQLTDFMTAHGAYFFSYPLIQLVNPAVRTTDRVFLIVFYNATAADGLANWIPLGSAGSSGGAFIPLAGTVALDPVTGPIEIDDATSDTFVFQTQTIAATVYTSGLVFNADASVGIQSKEGANITSFLVLAKQMQFSGVAGTFTGVTYAADYSAQYTARSLPDVDYVQNGVFTFTNKRNTRRIVALVDGAVVTVNADTTDVGILTSTQDFQIAYSGTPTNGQVIEIWVISAAAQVISYTADFTATVDVPLVVATSGAGLLDKLYFEWVASASEWQAAAKNLGGNA